MNALIETGGRPLSATADTTATPLVQHNPQPSELAKALGLARDKCRAAAKDAKNQHHNYKYASADEVIDVAKAALDGTGLSLLPSCPKLRVIGSGPQAIFAMTRNFALVHASGESLPLGEMEWPVLPDKGRPVDKAYAIAITSSLAYLYRDLLAMPRGTDDDMSARNDTQAPATPPQQYQPPPPPQEPAAPAAPAQTLQEAIQGEQEITDAQYQELAKLVRETGTDARAICDTFTIPVLQKLSQKFFPAVRDRLLSKRSATTPPPAAQPQPGVPAASELNLKRVLELRAQVDQLLEAIQYPADAFKKRIKELYRTTNAEKLTESQLTDLVERLTAAKAQAA